MSTNVPTVSPLKPAMPWYTVLLPALTTTCSCGPSPSATASVKLSPDGAIALISPSRAATLPLFGLVGCGENTAGVTSKVGVIDQDAPLSQQLLGSIADCETCKSISRPMLDP